MRMLKNRRERKVQITLNELANNLQKYTNNQDWKNWNSFFER